MADLYAARQAQRFISAAPIPIDKAKERYILGADDIAAQASKCFAPLAKTTMILKLLYNSSKWMAVCACRVRTDQRCCIVCILRSNSYTTKHFIFPQKSYGVRVCFNNVLCASVCHITLFTIQNSFCKYL